MSNTLNPHHGRPGHVVRDRRDVICPKCGKSRRRAIKVCKHCERQQKEERQ